MDPGFQVARWGLPLPGWSILDAGRLFVDPTFLRLARAQGWTKLESLAAPTGGETVRVTPTRRTSREVLSGETCFRKVHFHGFAGAGVRDRLRLLVSRPSSPARLELARNRLLASQGFLVPEPVLLAERRWSASVLVTRGVPSGRSLELLGEASLAALAGSLARLVARLHSRGLYHRDLYLDHFLLDPLDRIWITDLQRLIRPCFTRRWRVKDLAALLHSSTRKVTDRALLRFLVCYARLTRLPTRILARRVHAKQRRMARHRPRHDR